MAWQTYASKDHLTVSPSGGPVPATIQVTMTLPGDPASYLAPPQEPEKPKPGARKARRRAARGY